MEAVLRIADDIDLSCAATSRKLDSDHRQEVGFRCKYNFHRDHHLARLHPQSFFGLHEKRDNGTLFLVWWPAEEVTHGLYQFIRAAGFCRGGMDVRE
jgi:hypothetical protein